MMRIALLAIAALLPTSVVAQCPDVPPVKYGVGGTAEAYSSTGGYSLNEHGVLVFDYGSNYGGLGKWENPFFVARYAHALYRDWMASGCADEDLLAKFLLQVEFLAASAIRKDGVARWEYPFENTHFRVPAGWISGIGQSLIAGALYRAYATEQDGTFRLLASEAAQVYRLPVAAGGVITEDETGLWIQEVPASDGASAGILNGHITGLLGLRDVAYLLDEEWMHETVSAAVETVRGNVLKFDAGFASFYALNASPDGNFLLAPRGDYNALHARQLSYLHEIDADPLFADMSALFQSYEDENDVTRLASGSIAPDTHGPAEAAAFLGGRYWSVGEFPAWYETRFSAPTAIDGIFIQSRTAESAPRAFSVSVQLGGHWQTVWSSATNTNTQTFLRFGQPVTTSSVRLEIEGDSGAGLVALDAVMPIRAKNSVTKSNELSLTVCEVQLRPGMMHENECSGHPVALW